MSKVTRQGVKDLNSLGKRVKASETEEFKYRLCDHEFEYEFGVLTCVICGSAQEHKDEEV